MRRFLVLALLVGLAALPAAAQTQYGSLSGQVLDDQQQPLPGAMVTLAGPAMQGTRTAVTDGEGRYRFVPVPPGDGYTVKFELQGFNVIDKSGIIVNVSKETRINAEMSLSQFAETITVAADKIVVDTTKSGVETNVDWDLVDSLATNRTFQSMMQMAPGVKSGNNPYVHGASNDGNVYMVDGVDTTDPRTQTWGSAINWDTIQEAQVQTGGFQAEFGRALGGVVNLVTKSGGNKFSATARVIKTDVDWSAEPGIDDETGGKKAGATRTDEIRPSLTLGGPILRDRLWFYVAYEGRDRTQTFSRYPSIEDVQTGSTTLVEGDATYEGRYISGKLTLQINPSHSVVGYYNEDPIDLEPLRAGWYGPLYAQSVEQSQYQGGDNGSFQWYGVLNPSWFVEAKYQFHGQELNVEPLAPMDDQPYMYDLNARYYYGDSYYLYESSRDRQGINLVSSYYLDTEAGSHQLKAGADYMKIEPTAGRLYNPMGYYQTRNYGTTPYRKFMWYDQQLGNTTDQDYYAVFVQDQWRIKNFTVNFGIRAESTEIFQNQGNSVVKFDFADQIAPRLGFAYDLNGDSIHASIGRFYGLATNYIADYFNYVPTDTARFSWNGSCEVTAGTPVYQYADSCWNQDYRYNLGASATIDPNLKSNFVDEFTIGYDKLLSSQFAASANFVWRQQDDAIDWYDPEYTGYYHITNVIDAAKNDGYLDNEKFMEYQGIELSLKKRLGNDGFQFIAAYTYVLKSRAWNTDWANSGPFIFTSPDSMNRLWYGKSESPHDFKFNGSYTAPWRTTLGITAFWSSGPVYTPTLAGDYGSVPQARRGSETVGDQWEADVHVEHPVKVGPVDFAGYVDIFNVFNNQGVTSRRGAMDNMATFGQPTGWQAPRRYQAGIKIQY